MSQEKSPLAFSPEAESARRSSREKTSFITQSPHPPLNVPTKPYSAEAELSDLFNRHGFKFDFSAPASPIPDSDSVKKQRMQIEETDKALDEAEALFDFSQSMK
jgi:hypothetical protein